VADWGLDGPAAIAHPLHSWDLVDTAVGVCRVVCVHVCRHVCPSAVCPSVCVNVFMCRDFSHFATCVQLGVLLNDGHRMSVCPECVCVCICLPM